jgi:DNA polymerase III sliding clamp (beta) subunit (PCNA family)
MFGNCNKQNYFAAGNDDLRPVMSGVFFQFSPQGLTFVATDAQQISKYARNGCNGFSSG